MGYNYIDPDKITSMLFNDAEYVVEFCEAGVSSFDEFVENFRTHLMDRNMEELRKAGHKIKPGAQMMGADEVVEEYENAKILLQNEAGNNELKQLASKMQEMCLGIKDDLAQLAKNQN